MWYKLFMRRSGSNRDARAAFVLRVLMEREGYSPQGLVDAMLVAGCEHVPSRATVDRVLRDGAVPQRRYRASIARFLGREADTVWRVRGLEGAAA